MSRKRDVLDKLKRDELLTVVDRFDLPVEDRRARGPLVEALTGSRKAGIAAILEDLSRDRLKEICRALGLDESGREKAAIIARIAGEAPPAPEAPESSPPPQEKAPVSPTASSHGSTGVRQPRASQQRRTMALKKSDLYSSIWQSCDELRGGMDASQYKDYVLVFLFLKYISDRYAGQPFAPITIPPGASFADMVALKGTSDIGDKINTTIISPLAKANQQLSQSDFPDFNDPVKLGDGKEKVERLTNLIAIFENPALNFSKNRADGDDILGDAYEYLMRHFATESGKSKGQFYTPAEVSRVMAQILGLRTAKTTPATTVYDPTCGSGSLLLKVADAARTEVTIYGQEKDAATSGLARMNMILHDYATADIRQGNTLANPFFMEGGTLKTFDYVVANPPFSDKRWSTGVDPQNEPYERFKPFGVPPAKQGDYAYLLHIVRSLKSTGKGACILPHGVLFRGNAEADIRRALVRKGYIKGIIGLPANLFFGTGIPACIVVIDKEDAQARKGIFMIDASSGFMKDGPKNRLREMDIHRIVDVFSKLTDVPKYARMVPFEEIEKNDFNLNLPRYIDSQIPEDLQDIEGHLRGGIPEADIDALDRYWAVCPELRHTLFQKLRPGYLRLAVEKSAIKSTIYEHPEFASFIAGMNAHFAAWRKKRVEWLKALEAGCHPKEIIAELSESLLDHYAGKPLIDRYDVYQHLMDYWAATMQDDCYLIAADGWIAETYRVTETKNGKEKDKGWTCDLIPKALLVARYFAKEQAAIDEVVASLEGVTARLTEMEEEHGGEDGAFADLDKVNKANVATRLREILGDKDAQDEAATLTDWLKLNHEEGDLKKRLKEAEATLDVQAHSSYPALTETEIKTLVVDDKWLAALEATIHGEMDRVSQQLTQRVRELAERYETPLPKMADRLAELEERVNRHLGAMQELLMGKHRLSGLEIKPGDKQTEAGVIPEDWEVYRLGEGIKLTSGYHVLAQYCNTDGDGIAYLTGPSDFPNGKIQHTKYTTRPGTTCNPSDILVTVKGSGAGALVLSDATYCISRQLMAIRVLNWNTQFVLYTLLRDASLFGASATGLIPGLSRGDILNKGIPFPPTKAEQEAIAATLSDMDAEITALESKLAKARKIKQGMMQELLTGRIRLV